MNVKALQTNEPAWEEFLERQDHRIFHTPAYKAFADAAFRTPMSCWASEESGRLKALLPVFRVRNILLGSRLISTAFLEYGGFCGERDGVEAILDFLRSEYSDRYRLLEIRGGSGSGGDVPGSGPVRRIEYKRFILKLGDRDSVWEGVQREKRKAVRKAEKSGVAVRDIPRRELASVYRLYGRNMKAFGSPPFPLSYFQSFYDHLVPSGLGKILGAYVDNRLAAFLSGFVYRDRIHIVIAVSDKNSLALRPNDALHWAFIEFGCLNGLRIFDFGRAREGSGQYDYKKKWGAEVFDLEHDYWLWRKQAPPHVDPDNPRFKILTGLWRRLPLAVTQSLGPRIRESLGI